MIKKTVRRYTFNIPNGEFRKEYIRTLHQDEQGIPYFVNNEYDIPLYSEKIVDYNELITEEQALNNEIAGAKVIHCQDFVTIEE